MVLDQRRVSPGPARLEIWRKTSEKWLRTRIEDGDSNVFHKAIPYEDGILTIGAQKALEKMDSQRRSLVFHNPVGKIVGRKIQSPARSRSGRCGWRWKRRTVTTHDYGVVAVFDSPTEIVELDPKRYLCS